MIAIVIGFGGRMASGQLALVVGASVTSFCWMLHLLTTKEARYAWTGSEWLWLSGILVAIVQIVPLPTGLLLGLAPQLKEILPLWFATDSTSPFPAGWHQLSLAPWETTSAVATFVSYALLFLVMCQRIRTIDNVEQSLCRASLSSIAMMIFALLQYFLSNGKFFWVFDYPALTTYSYPLGCFTNRNHLAQFLALGAAPTIWWLLRRLQQQVRDRRDNRGMPTGMHVIAVTLLAVSMTGIGLTILMTLSRGGLLALVIASLVSTVLMCRNGLASLSFALAIMFAGLVFGGLSSMGKYEALLGSRLEQHSGRTEIWLANLKVACAFPAFGTGIGTHSDAYRLQMDSGGPDGLEYTHAESGYLQIASESGLAGLFVAVLFIATALNWILRGLWNPDTDASSAAAAILASALANVIHGAFDFFWYTPSCMLLMALQLACAARLCRLTRQNSGGRMWSIQIPRLVSAAAICGLAGLTVWMYDIKFPAALAENHRLQAARISEIDASDFSEDEKESEIESRLKETILAAKCDLRDARLQESAALAYVQLFDIRQQRAENSMSSDMLRDAVKASGFQTPGEANEWLNRSIGPNLKYLKLANRSLKRALANGPLRSKSYVVLNDLCFLDRPDDPAFSQRCLNQSLRLRPEDPDTLFLIGISEMQESHVERALEYWRPAFKRSPRVQERIATVLAGQMSLEFFEKEFQPEWKSFEIIGRAFAKAGRTDEAQLVKRRYISDGMQLAKSMKTDEQLESTLMAIRNTCHELGDIPAAAGVLTYAVKRIPHSYSIRYLLGLDLMAANRAADAAEHLQWCVDRRPRDAGLRKTASIAIIERLKRSPESGHDERDIEQTGFRN